MKYLLSVLIIVISINRIYGQIKLQSYLDIGENNVSEGVFIKNAYTGSYQYQKYHIEAGIQFDLKSHNPNTLTGIDIIGSREFSVKDFTFDIQGFLIVNRFSDILHETDWGLKFDTKKFKHFLFALGADFKTYKINSAVWGEYKINRSNCTLYEHYTLLYVITAYLKPQKNNWNVGLSCTNVDYYIIEQATNPVFNLQMIYKPKPNLTLFLESWYRQAGILNMSANYFGHFFRGGIRWSAYKPRY